MSRRKYLYRVTAHYPITETSTQVRTWHYQSLTAVRRRKQMAEQDYSEAWNDGEPGSNITVPPASFVKVERSEPISWQPSEVWAP